MSASQLMNNSIPLNQWVGDLFKTLFFQPNDALAQETFNEFISDDVLVR